LKLERTIADLAGSEQVMKSLEIRKPVDDTSLEPLAVAGTLALNPYEYL